MQEILEEGKFLLTDEEGNEVEYSTLLTFYNKENNKNYVVYTDETEDEEGGVNIYASIYDPNSSELDLLPVETEEEWININSVLAEFTQEEVQ